MNYNNYNEGLKITRKFGCNILKPIFYQREEYNKIENKMESVINEEISKVLSQKHENEEVIQFKWELAKGQNLKKEQLN